MTAAAWVDRCRAYAQTRADAMGPGVAYVPCSACGGNAGPHPGGAVLCHACGGVGRVPEADPADNPPPAVVACAEVIGLYAAAQRLGMDGAVRVLGVEEIHPAGGEAVLMLGAELDRLEHLRACAEAARLRREHKERR